MPINKLYAIDDVADMLSRLEKDHKTLTPSEVLELAFIISKFGQDLEQFWDKHDKLGKLSVNFDV